jgi:hypothetical protein
MAAAKKIEPTEPEAALEPSPAPEHANQVCAPCGQHPLHPSTTAFTCEHGTWIFTPPESSKETPEEARAALLASLDEDELRALLAAKTPAS